MIKITIKEVVINDWRVNGSGFSSRDSALAKYLPRKVGFSMETNPDAMNDPLHSHEGFSLIELLVVMATLGLLASLAAPALASLAMGGAFNQALIEISGTYERARAYAVANNTYTYVGFTTPDTNGLILVGILGSGDGSRGGVSTSSGGTYTVGGTNALVLIDRLGKIQGSHFSDTIPAGSALNTNTNLTSASTPVSTNVQFACNSTVYGMVTLRNVVQFTPGGQARVAAGMPASVQVVLIPSRGDPANPVSDNANASAIRIAGLTGLVTVYRP